MLAAERTFEPFEPLGLWPMAAGPGPSFRWGAIKRRSAYNADGTEESTARQEDAIYSYVEQHKLGRIVATYTDIASAFDEKAKRPEFENALDDLRAGRIDGIIVWKLDRLTRRRNQMRRILTLLEDCGGRLLSVVEGIDTADPNKREITELVLNVYISASRRVRASQSLSVFASCTMTALVRASFRRAGSVRLGLLPIGAS